VGTPHVHTVRAPRVHTVHTVRTDQWIKRNEAKKEECVTLYFTSTVIKP
jgi:hypothetical protein